MTNNVRRKITKDIIEECKEFIDYIISVVEEEGEIKMVDTIIEGRMLTEALIDSINNHYDTLDIIDVWVRIRKVGKYPKDVDKLKQP